MVASTRIASAHGQLAEVARRQHGVFTRAQALACGLSARSIRRYVEAGQWRQLFPGVFMAATHSPSDIQRACGAVLLAGAGAVLSHMSAIALHGLGPWPAHVHLTVPHGRHRRFPDIRWHQSRILAAEDLAVLQGIPTTTIERTLLDAGTQADRALLQILVDEAVRLRLTGVGALAVRALEVRPDGRFGGRRLRQVLATIPPINADSVLEMVMARLLDAGGLGDYVHHHHVDVGGLTYELDFAYVAERLGLECDGAAFHERPSRRARDTIRDIDLARVGWRILHFDWDDVTADAGRTRRRILEALGRVGVGEQTGQSRGVGEEKCP